ncbi:MAG: YibE/F family protein [Oscillospiraceae bacterium]|nr:YibE/F family protein [Oscillospiraceae bacterium]
MKLRVPTKKQLLHQLPVLLFLVLTVVLWLLPTGFEDAVIYRDANHCAARVIAADNSAIVDTGLVRSGEQTCTIQLLGSPWKGQTVTGVNLLSGSLENDKLFVPGDKALVLINSQEGSILSVSMIDHYRIGQELFLGLAFIVFLVLFAGKTGLRAVLSFLFTVLAIWKVLIPSYLKGYHPIYVGLAVTFVLTLAIISLVYGFDRRTLAAVGGALAGLLVTCLLGALFTSQFKIHGAIMPYSESLLYSGYQGLNLTQIFMASIFIGSSGAVMDLAVDITSAVYEVVQKKPGIGWLEATRSGFNVGRAAMGTMTTTLLLAYSGGYVALLMVFMAQGTPLYNVFNYKYVSAEIIDTVVGSFGLVSVAPLTALASGLLLTRKKGPVLPAGEKQPQP